MTYRSVPLSQKGLAGPVMTSEHTDEFLLWPNMA